MAEQNNEKQTINFAGREIDKKEFGRRVQAKLGAWMDYQGLRGEERTDFIQAINDKMNGLFDGTLTSSEFGVIEGGAPNQENQYKQNGSRSEGFSLSRRHGFNPGENADIFLNGIAGTMDEGASTSRRSSKKAATWDKSLSTKQVMDSIFGEGNEGTAAQLKLWADKFDPVNNGVRSTEGRKKHIIEQLDNYIGRLNSGEFDLSDEDREAEIKRIGSLKNALYNNDSFELGKLAPWVSNLLFTDEEYYATPEAKQTAEQQNLAKQAEEYIKNGGENPYNKESNPDEWQATEDARKARLDQNFANDFDHYSTRSSQLREEHWLPKYNMITNDDVFRDWKYDGNYGWRHMLDALYQVHDDYSTDGSGYDLHTGLFGIGGNAKFLNSEIFTDENTTHDNVNLSGIIPDLYMRTYDEPNDSFTNTTKQHAMRSGNAYKGKFLSDYLNYYINKNPELFRTKKGESSFILPSMVDWNAGTAYLITQDMDQKGRIKQINIADYLPSIKENNPELYKELLKYYAEFKNYKLPASKNGGVLKAQFGSTLGNPAEDVEAQKADIEAMGQKEFDRQNLDKMSWENMTAAQKMRVGAIAADVVSTVSAFAPGYGTAIAAATGLGSTGVNLVADLNDPTVSTGQVFGNLAINAGLDIASLIPGVNASAGAAKIAKQITKIAPILLSAPAALGLREPVTKIINGETLTNADWKKLAYGMSAVAGITRIGTNAYRLHAPSSKYKSPGKVKTDEVSVEYTKNGVVDRTNIKKSDFDAINNQKTQEAALKMFREKVGAATNSKPEEISFTGNVTFGKKLKVLNRPLRGKEVFDKPDNIDQVRQAFTRSAYYRAKYPKLGLLFKTNDEMLGLVPIGQTRSYFGNPIFGSGSRVKTIDENYNLAREQAKVARNEVSTEYQAKIDKLNADIDKKTKENSIFEKDADILNQKGPTDISKIKNQEIKSAYQENIRLEKQLESLQNPKEEIARLEQQLQRVQSLRNKKQTVDGKKRKITNDAKQQKLIDQIKEEIALRKDKTKREAAIKDIKARLKANQDRSKQLAEKAKANAETGRKQLEQLNQDLIGLRGQANWDTYNKYSTLVEKTYGLRNKRMEEDQELSENFRKIFEKIGQTQRTSRYKKGGILKANLGTQIPPEAEKQTPQQASSNIGTVGEPASNTSTTEASTNTGSVGEAGNPTPSSTTYNAYDNGFMPEEQSSIYPSDIMQTLLQLEGNNAAHRYNYAMTQQQLSKIPYHKTPMIYGYKVHTSKPIEDQIAQTRALYNQMGNTAARGTADQGAAFAYKLTAATRATESTNPLTLRQSEFVQNSEDKAREAAYKTAESYHDVGDFNHEQDVKDYNDERDIWTQYLSQEGRIKMKDIALRQRGLAATSEQNYRRSVLAKQAEYTYRRLSEKKATHPEDWTDDDEQQLERAYRTWTQVNTPAPMNMPYAGFSNYYTAQRPLSNFSYWNN